MLDTTGGAGYEDPLERDPQHVLWDVLNEYLSPEEAESEYGVVVDLKAMRVVQLATEKLRRERRNQKKRDGPQRQRRRVGIVGARK